MKLIFIRHGQTDGNARGILIGQRRDEPLSEEGRRQAQEAATQLPGGIDIIFSSPLLRAVETAKIINARFNVPIEYRGDLQERDFGSLSGKTWKEAAQESRIPNLKELDVNLQWDYRPFGGESFEDVKSRLLGFIEEVKKHHPGKKVVVVAHGGILRTMHGLFSEHIVEAVHNASVHEFKV